MSKEAVPFQVYNSLVLHSLYNVPPIMWTFIKLFKSNSDVLTYQPTFQE